MAQNSSSIQIDSSIKNVFDVTTDLSMYHMWSGSIDSGYSDSPQTQLGTNFYEVFLWRGKREKTTAKVTEFIPCEKWSYESVLGPYRALGTYEFSSIDEHVTQVSVETKLESSSLLSMSFMFHLLQSFLTKRQLDKNLRELKRIIEDERTK